MGFGVWIKVHLDTQRKILQIHLPDTMRQGEQCPDKRPLHSEKMG